MFWPDRTGSPLPSTSGVTTSLLSVPVPAVTVGLVARAGSAPAGSGGKLAAALADGAALADALGEAALCLPRPPQATKTRRTTARTPGGAPPNRAGRPPR